MSEEDRYWFNIYFKTETDILAAYNNCREVILLRNLLIERQQERFDKLKALYEKRSGHATAMRRECHTTTCVWHELQRCSPPELYYGKAWQTSKDQRCNSATCMQNCKH